jgi:hypothetical protein
VDYWRYQKARREYEERTGEEFPGLGEDRQRKERQRAAEARVAEEEEAARANEDPHPPPRRLPFAFNRCRRRFK